MSLRLYIFGFRFIVVQKFVPNRAVVFELVLNCSRVTGQNGAKGWLLAGLTQQLCEILRVPSVPGSAFMLQHDTSCGYGTLYFAQLPSAPYEILNFFVNFDTKCVSVCLCCV